MLIFVLYHAVFRTVNRTELAYETNDCFAKMRLQFKNIGSLKLASVMDTLLNHYTSMKRFDQPMVMSYGQNYRSFPGLDRIFFEEKIRRTSN